MVDAKAPLAAYLEAVEAGDDATRAERLRNHAAQVRAHVMALSRKSYAEQFSPAPEFVILFLPGESFFSAALESDPGLIEAGVSENVILATPTTLIALLRAVAYGWRQEALAKNAAEISELGRDLYKRLAGMAEHWSKVGTRLGSAVKAYNEATGSLEGSVLVKARRFAELEAVPGNLEIPVLEPLERAVRELRGPAVNLVLPLNELPVGAEDAAESR